MEIIGDKLGDAGAFLAFPTFNTRGLG